MTAGPHNNPNNSEDRPRTSGNWHDRAAFETNKQERTHMFNTQTNDTTTDSATGSTICVPAAWVVESDLDADREAVIHTREGDIAFRASTGTLNNPLVDQHLRLEQIDRLTVLRGGEINAPLGLGYVREDVEVILVQSEGARQIEICTWPVAEARSLHAALGQLLAAFDANGGDR